MRQACAFACTALFPFSVLATLTLAAIACGGDEPADLDEIASMSADEAAEMAREIRDLSDVRACELLTTAEVEAATGMVSGQPEDVSQVQGQLPMCHWPSADGSGRILAAILVTRGDYSSYEQFIEISRGQMDDMEMEFSEEDWQHVPDVGDFGVWLDEEFAGGMLQVYHDGLMVQVDADPAEDKDELEVSKELAMKIFDRLD
jgi:hypothetical protein